MTTPIRRQASVAAALVAVLVLSGGPGEALKLTVEVRDRSAGAARDAARVSLELDETAGTELRRIRSGEYEHEGPAPRQRLRLAVQAPRDFADRDISLRVPLVVARRDIRLRVHLMTAVEITYATTGKAIPCLRTSAYDSCLAWWEYAADRMREQTGELTQLHVRVAFNHALALREACQFLAYDTCATAVERLDELITQIAVPRNAPLFQAEALHGKKLEAARAVARQLEVTGRYDAVRAFYARSDYGAAADLVEHMIDRADHALAVPGITLERLRLDAANARSRLGDSLTRSSNRAEATEAWRKALEHFDAIPGFLEARRDRVLVQGKLDRF